MSPSTVARRPEGLLADTLKMTLLALVLGGLFGLAPIALSRAEAQEPTQIRIDGNAFGATRKVDMSNNKSLILDLPIDVKEVIVSQPSVATALLRSQRRAIVQTLAAGDTNIFFLDATGRTIVVLDISVKPQASSVASALRDTFSRVLPNSNIQVESVELTTSDGSRINRVVLSGTAGSSDDVNKALSIAAQFAGGTENVASVINVAGSQQVMLKVTVAEVNRNLTKQFGINLGGTFTDGGLKTSIISKQPFSGASTGNGVDVGVDIGPLSIDAEIRAMEGRGAARVLAEPVLAAISGQPAEFTAGGEFPLPTVNSDGEVSVSYREFGIKLNFVPTVKSNGVIGLVVDTSSSELSSEGAVTINNTTLPGIKNRQAKTTVELGAGQTLAIGGLIQDTTRTQINRLPGLGDIPILGTLFRSRDFIRSQTELMILVTPYFVRPTDEKPRLPTDNLVLANDAEAIFLGHIETVYGVGPAGTRGSYDGSVGFLLD